MAIICRTSLLRASAISRAVQGLRLTTALVGAGAAVGFGAATLWNDQAQAQDWLGVVDGDFYNTANWSTGTVPGSGDTAIFDRAPVRSVNVVSTAGLAALNFTAGADAYQITTAPATILQVGTIDNQSANVQTLNLSQGEALELSGDGLTGPGKTIFNTSAGGTLYLNGTATAGSGRFIGGDGALSLSPPPVQLQSGRLKVAGLSAS